MLSLHLSLHSDGNHTGSLRVSVTCLLSPVYVFSIAVVFLSISILHIWLILASLRINLYLLHFSTNSTEISIALAWSFSWMWFIVCSSLSSVTLCVFPCRLYRHPYCGFRFAFFCLLLLVLSSLHDRHLPNGLSFGS